MIAYASNFHSSLNDGYFVQAASRARSICGTGGVLPPGCIPQLPDAVDRLVRTDLPVPVYRAMTENDIDRGSPPQEDNGLFRYYEIAGTAHTTVHEDIEILPAGVIGPDPLFLEDACLHPINSLADGPVFGSYMYNAMWQNMQDTVRDGTDAPHAELIERDGAGDIVRDAFGNAIGGISPTQIQVPVATYGPQNEPNPANLPRPLIALWNLFCFLSGTVTPFGNATLHDLYPRRGDYVGLVNDAASQLKADGFLLPQDLQKVLQVAAVEGLGFELVLVLPLLMRLRRGRAA
jgi:hypothetical protein